MLVVSRRAGQSILIGRDIEVFLLEVDGSQVRVGISAPRSIRVLRRELLTQVESENRRALATDANVLIREFPRLVRDLPQVELPPSA